MYDRHGAVYAWLGETGKIYGLNGENLAFICGNSVYDWSGRHIGWWQDGHVRDVTNSAFVFRQGAKGLGVMKPMKQNRWARISPF